VWVRYALIGTPLFHPAFLYIYTLTSGDVHRWTKHRAARGKQVARDLVLRASKRVSIPLLALTLAYIHAFEHGFNHARRRVTFVLGWCWYVTYVAALSRGSMKEQGRGKGVQGVGTELGFGQLAFRAPSGEDTVPPPRLGWPAAHQSELQEGEHLVERPGGYCTRPFQIPLSRNGVGSQGFVSGRLELFEVTVSALHTTVASSYCS
jgi:hypothetical protein